VTAAPGQGLLGATREIDVLVVGSGIAGLTFALEAARRHRVLLVTKKERADSGTNWARGGIAAVLGDDDAPELHLRDTLEAGAGLCHPDAVEVLVREGPTRVSELADRGADFARGPSGLVLGREGGHSRRRIVHAGDRTGREIETTLLGAVEGTPRIEVLEDHLAVDLLVEEWVGRGEDGAPPVRCVGALVMDRRTGTLSAITARTTFLATGGWGQAYRYTTNPTIATGDGLAMAYRAGARVANMEFMQFHPTSLHGSGDPAFLLTEAIRGEGAVLRRLDGTEFMARYHPMGSLAPRDVVARAIDRECREHGDPYVLLDLGRLDRVEAEMRFPDALEGCRARGIDPFGPGIPVVPAAHYGCGGIVTDLHGRTSLPGLLAAGEVACTGVHGANRLASNSLPEALVFAHRAAAVMEEERERLPAPASPAGPPPWASSPGPAGAVGRRGDDGEA
jgi:L-aspartate oxidase